MNLSCEIVMDLLPLYIDGLASQESGAEIKEHLRACPQCRKYYHSYHKITAAPLPPQSATSASADGDKYHELSARMRKRHIVSTAAILGIVATSICGTLLSVFMTHKKKVK